MVVKYDFRTNPLAKEGEKQLLYPRIILAGTKTTEDIVEEISHFSSFSSGCVKGVLEELTHYVVKYLGRGYNVKIDDLGSFSVSLTSRRVTDKNEIHAQSVKFNKVCFRESPDLIGRVSTGARLERAEYGFSESSSKHTKEERLEILKRYLTEHESITRMQYSDLTGLLRSTALRELEAWVEAGMIIKRGRRAQARFLWKSE